MLSCVARQPILDAKTNIFGYEILYRRGEGSASFDGIDADAASSETIMNSFYNMGIERLTNGKRAFINFTEKLLLDGVATILPREILVVELLEDILPSPMVLDACRELRQKGYTIALDDFRIQPEYMPLLDIAQIVKVDFIDTPREQIASFAKTFTKKPIKLLAEKIENNEEFEFAKSLGFSYFQGYTFSKPVVMKSDKTPSPLKANCLRLIRLAFDPDVQFIKLAQVIKQDVALSYRLLRVVNSAYFGLRYSVNNIRQALAILGMNEVKKWITLISLSEVVEGKPDELIVTSLARARHLELIAPHVRLLKKADDLFMVGLMSLMDIITDMPFEEVFELTKLSKELTDAIDEKKGVFGELLQMAIYYEESRWQEAADIAESFKLDFAVLASSYLEAIEWTDLMMVRSTKK